MTECIPCCSINLKFDSGRSKWPCASCFNGVPSKYVYYREFFIVEFSYSGIGIVCLGGAQEAHILFYCNRMNYIDQVPSKERFSKG